MHVPSEFLAAIAAQVGELMWADPTDDEEEGDDDGSAGPLVPA